MRSTSRGATGVRRDAGAGTSAPLDRGRTAVRGARDASPGERATGFAPVIGRDARVLILGSFPSVASLAAGQYYAHPRNEFWPILGRLLGEPLAELPYEARLDRVRRSCVAIWDVLEACVRPGSLDADIRDARANDFERVVAQAPRLAAVAFNGATAAKHAPWFAERGLATYRMPSTSPAHRTIDYAGKLERWGRLVDDGWLPEPPGGWPPAELAR